MIAMWEPVYLFSIVKLQWSCEPGLALPVQYTSPAVSFLARNMRQIHVNPGLPVYNREFVNVIECHQLYIYYLNINIYKYGYLQIVSSRRCYPRALV